MLGSSADKGDAQTETGDEEAEAEAVDNEPQD